MEAPPAGTVAQRLPMATPPGRRAMPEIPGSPVAAGPVAPVSTVLSSAVQSASSAGAAGVSPRPLPVLPVLPVARLAAGAGRHRADEDAGHAPLPGPRMPTSLAGTGAPSAGASPATVASPIPVAPAARPAARATVPTLGARPLRPSVTAQREAPAGAGVTGGGTPQGPGLGAGAASASAGAGSASTGSRALPAPVAARWSTGGELPATVEALPAASPGEDPVPLQRLAAGSGAASASSAGSAPGSRVDSAPREIVFPPRDGLPGGGTATPAFGGDASIGRSAAAVGGPGRPGFAAAPVSSAGHPPAMTLHHASPATVQATSAPAAPAPVVARIVADPAPAAAPSVQASRSAGAAAPLVVTATPVVQRIDGAAPDPGGPPAGHSDTELDELARALFGRIRTHLRSEVIHEREAKGLSFDAF